MTSLLRQLTFPEQRRAIDKMVTARGGIVWWKVGEGKTRIGLFTFARLQEIYEWSLPSICLVVCRRRAFHDWQSEIRQCFPEFSVYHNVLPVQPPGNHPVFLLVSHGELAITRKREVNEKFASLQNNLSIRFVILDELWLYANNKSARSKAAKALTKGRIAVGLSGTVMKARDVSEIYNQAMAVRKHGCLAGSLTKFKSMHMRCLQPEGNRNFPITLPKKGAYKRIMADATDFADVHFPKGERLINEQFHTVPATKQQAEYFKELREFYSIDALGLEYNHAIVIGVKAQQIANGWIKDSEGKVFDIPTLKVEKLEDELSDIITAGERAVVWCAFRYDVKMLAARLPFASLQMLGGEDFDIDAWNNGDARVCIATEASGSSVNHLSNTPYAIYYSANYKWLDMQQSRGRTDRGMASRHNECFYKYLQVEGSMDAHVYRAALESGRSERKLIIEAAKQWLKL